MSDIKTIRDDIASIKADLADGETTFEHAVECLTDAANTATDVADAEKARAYAAEAKVCELVEHIRRTEEALADGESPDGVWIPRENLPPRFSSTTDIRAKWCPVSEVIGAFTKAGLALGVHSTMGLDVHIKRIVDDSAAALRDLETARNEVQERDLWLGNAREEVKEAMRERDEAVAEAWRLNAVDGLKAEAESQRDEVGVQLVAAQERLALAMETVDALSMTCLMWSHPDKIKEAKADVMFVRGSLDAVPGDASARPEAKRDPVLSTVRAATSPLDWSDDDDAVPGDEGAALGTPFDEAGTTNPDKKGTQ